MVTIFYVEILIYGAEKFNILSPAQIFLQNYRNG